MTTESKTAIFPANVDLFSKAKAIADQLDIPLVSEVTHNHPALLVLSADRLELRLTAKDAPGAVYVDFLEGALAHRRQYGGGRGQLIARAVGVKQKEKPFILDLTAGLGRDGFVLSLLGCRVVMCERSPVIHALLSDGLLRAQQKTWFTELSLKLLHADSLVFASNLFEADRPDVVYLDPMFPDKTKSALVKKEMRVLRAVVGDDPDAGALLTLALGIAKKRVVVKRAKLAPTLTDRAPDLVYKGKSSRFDVYFSSK